MHTIKTIGIIVASLILGVIAGVAINHRETRSQQESQPFFTTKTAASAAVETVATDPRKAEFLLQYAIRQLTKAPEECDYVWNAIQEVEKRQALSRLCVQTLKEDFVKTIDMFAGGLQSPDEIERLYRLRNEAVATLGAPVSSKAAVQPSANPGSPPLTANETLNLNEIASLFEEGLKEAAGSDRAELLTQMAIRLQDATPALTPLLWKRYADYLDKQNLAAEERVLRLTSYLESVDKAAVASHNKAEFESVWGIRTDVTEKRNAAAKAVLSEIKEELAKKAEAIQQKSEKGNRVDAIKALSSVSEDILPKLNAVKVAFQSVRPDSETAINEIIDKVAFAVNEVLSLAEKEVAALKQDRDKEKKADLTENVPEPAEIAATSEKKEGVSDKPKAGRYEALLRRIVELHQALDEADLQSCLTAIQENKQATGPDASQDEQLAEYEKRFSDLQKQIEELSVDVPRRQGLRYNLWALSVIYRAQESGDWDGILGRIDVGLLQPTVNALYSSTYDSLIHKETDPRARVVTVQRILNSEKIGLPSF